MNSLPVIDNKIIQVVSSASSHEDERGYTEVRLSYRLEAKHRRTVLKHLATTFLNGAYPERTRKFPLKRLHREDFINLRDCVCLFTEVRVDIV